MNYTGEELVRTHARDEVLTVYVPAVETEAKVREATNNEPWGASSTLMQDIANATFN